MASSGVSQSPLDLFAQCPLCVVTKIIELEGVAFPSSSSFRLTSPTVRKHLTNSSGSHRDAERVLCHEARYMSQVGRVSMLCFDPKNQEPYKQHGSV